MSRKLRLSQMIHKWDNFFVCAKCLMLKFKSIIPRKFPVALNKRFFNTHPFIAVELDRNRTKPLTRLSLWLLTSRLLISRDLQFSLVQISHLQTPLTPIKPLKFLSLLLLFTMQVSTMTYLSCTFLVMHQMFRKPRLFY